MNTLDDQLAWTGRFNNSAPQDWALEVAPIELALQKMDARLRIIWNPHAFLACPGVQDVYGRLTKPMEYAGRWQVVVKGALDGLDTMILQLGSESDPTKPYRAVGWWLVEYLQQVDTANKHQAELMQKMLDDEFKAQQDRKAKERAERVEYLTKLYTDHCGIKALQFTGAKFTPTEDRMSLSDFHVHILDPNDKEKVQVMPGPAKDCAECSPTAKPYNKPGPKPKSVGDE